MKRCYQCGRKVPNGVNNVVGHAPSCPRLLVIDKLPYTLKPLWVYRDAK